MPRDELIKGHAYGPSIVPVSQIDEVSLRVNADKCMSILRFVDRDSVPHQLLMGTRICHPPLLAIQLPNLLRPLKRDSFLTYDISGPVDAVIPNSDSEKAYRSMDALAVALRKQNRVALIRSVLTRICSNTFPEHFYTCSAVRYPLKVDVKNFTMIVNKLISLLPNDPSLSFRSSLPQSCAKKRYCSEPCDSLAA